MFFELTFGFYYNFEDSIYYYFCFDFSRDMDYLSNCSFDHLLDSKDNFAYYLCYNTEVISKDNFDYFDRVVLIGSNLNYNLDLFSNLYDLIFNFYIII